MINFYQQVGYSGLLIIVLCFIAIFASIRGVVLVILIKKQAKYDNSIVNSIVTMTKKQDKASRNLVIHSLMQVHMKGVFASMYFLKLCAAIGPLLGLLGTVIGMVDVFSNLAQKAMPDPSLLAGGIWQALLTTVMGLSLAIPALIVHYYLLVNLRDLRTKITLMSELKDE